MDNANVVEAPVATPTQISLLGVLRIPAVRQLILLIGVAAAVAIGFAIVLWSQSPGYVQIAGSIDADEAAQVTDALRAADIDYKLSDDGQILVAGSRYHEARMQLAGQDLLFSGDGMDSLDDQSSFGVSQFMESARYKHAQEAELARSIASLGPVRDARVHLALPEKSAFLRDDDSASASVVLQLYSGRSLGDDQAAAIAHMVAAGIPNLDPKDVTLVDQRGRLLSNGSSSANAMAATQFKFARELEQNYKRRIENLLGELVGAGRVRAEVVADIDFTYVEETRESFDPTRTVVRSEQVREDQTSVGAGASGGVPGALTNQPPQATGIPPEQLQAAGNTTSTGNSSRSSTRNFEVDRTIRHTRPQSGAIRKLSVAVLVDDTPLSEESTDPSVTDADLERYTTLVREAVGFNEARGDTVVVMSETFLAGEPPVEAEPPAIWQKPIFQDSVKQALGAILVLVIAFGVVRPMLKGVVTGGQVVSGEYIPAGAAYATDGGGAGYNAAQLSGGGGSLAPPSYDEKVAAARNISGHDPARVAQVVKKWVTSDE